MIAHEPGGVSRNRLHFVFRLTARQLRSPSPSDLVFFRFREMIVLFCLWDLGLPACVRGNRIAAMIEDEKSTEDPESQLLPPRAAANDNGHGAKDKSMDTRILLVARALGRLIAREQLDRLDAANDNTPQSE